MIITDSLLTTVSCERALMKARVESSSSMPRSADSFLDHIYMRNRLVCTNHYTVLILC